jgi:hypothetical protein
MPGDDDDHAHGTPPRVALPPGGPRPVDQIHRVGAADAVRRNDDGTLDVVPIAKGEVTMTDTLVATPGGFRPLSMVHKIDAGNRLDLSAGRLRMLTAKGDHVADFGAVISRPSGQPLLPANVARQPLVQLRTSVRVPGQSGPQERLLEQRLPGLGSGWITFASWTNTTGQPITSFKTTWTVPQPPATRSGQLLYLFNGIQNSSFIYQPVLQWGESPAGGGNNWAVASWYVSGNNGPAFHSGLVNVNPGDALTGIMTLTGRSTVGTAQLFDYDCEFQGIAGAGFPIQNVEELTYCVQTLEAYSVQKCSDYPSGKTSMTAIEVRTSAGTPALSWTASTPVTDCGQSTMIVSNASPGGEVDLLYCTRPAAPAALTQRDRLLPDQGLTVGQSITSADGRFVLVLQADGNLVLYRGGQALWASNTAGHPEVFDVVMQSDGNLVMYNTCGRPMWASDTVRHPGAFLVLQNDANAVIYDPANHPLWASNTVVPGQPASPTQPDRLLPNQGLTIGQSITSADGRFRLVLQSDGNLVLYHGSQPLWASNTAGHPDVWYAVMQADGNLVVYNVRSQALWASGTAGHPGAWLIAQNDGNLVVYDPANHPLWASNTVVPAQPAAPTQPDRLLPNQGLMAGQSVASGDGRFRFVLQLDGNLVLYGPGNVALWASNTAGHGDVWDAVMQGDGNLVIYNFHGRALWASNTAGHPGAWFVVQNDGNVVIYDPANHPLWAANTVVSRTPVPPSRPDRLLPGEGLTIGHSITSSDGRFRLVLQADGNLVLYAPRGIALWASNTAGHADVWNAVMQSDGNLVVYNVFGHPLWASNTAGHPGASLVAQSDGNLVIYDPANHPLWASNTVAPGVPAAPSHTDQLLPGQGLLVGQSIASADGRYRFVLQADGNLVLYAPGNAALWASNTAGHGDVWDAVMQSDGNLVVYNIRGRALWASNTAGQAGAHLVIQNDANAVIYDPGNHARWASNTQRPPQPQPPTQGDRLLPGQGLVFGQQIVSANGHYRLVMQGDGNLVLYDTSNHPLWASNTANHPDVWDVVMQSDGNLVIYNFQAHAMWASNTAGHGGAYLIMQNDANVVIYDAANHAIWATNTAR